MDGTTYIFFLKIFINNHNNYRELKNKHNLNYNNYIINFKIIKNLKKCKKINGLYLK